MKVMIRTRHPVELPFGRFLVMIRIPLVLLSFSSLLAHSLCIYVPSVCTPNDTYDSIFSVSFTLTFHAHVVCI